MDTFSVVGDAPGFVPVRRQILDCDKIEDPTTIAVFVALTSFMNHRDSSCWPSYASIGKRSRCSAETAKRHIMLLVELGFVQKESGKENGGPNTYHIINPYGSEGRTPVIYPPVTGDLPGSTPVTHEQYSMNNTKEQKNTSVPENGNGHPSALKKKAIFYDYDQRLWRGITQGDLDFWQEDFDGVDVRGELMHMKAWLDSHPKKKDFKKFVANWLLRAQGKSTTFAPRTYARVAR